MPVETAAFAFAIVPFALCFPRNTLADWAWWKRALGLMVGLSWIAYVLSIGYIAPFERDWRFERRNPAFIGIWTLFYSRR